MSRLSDREYHEARALAEVQLAEAASDPAVAATHRELAALHKRRLIEIVHLGEPQQQQPRPLAISRPLQKDVS